MPAKRELTMRQIRQLLRLSHDGHSTRDIALALNAARTTIQSYLKRVRAAGAKLAIADRSYGRCAGKAVVRQIRQCAWGAPATAA
jgi:response regulator of citrate/malate metabolism